MDTMLRKALRKHNELRQQLDNVLLGDDGDAWEAELRKFLAQRPCWVKKTKNDYLKSISGGTEIIIGETDGMDTIARASDVFTCWIDSDFVNYGTNVKGQPTKETPVQVFEMIKNGTFAQIFGGFGENLDRLCLTQSQIIFFVKNHSKWLRTDGYVTFFLFKENGEFFVARVGWCGGGLKVFASRLSLDSVWRAGPRRCLVAPRL
jgi:hypothetical protein